MSKSLTEYLRPAIDLWGSWPPWRRWTLLGVSALVLCSLLLWAGVFGPSARMNPLFTRLEPVDASAITSALEEKGISYRLEDDGRTILVPSADVHRLRLHFAGEGIPGGGVVGFESMDQSSWATTDFGRQVSYIRALQGELTRTIRQMEGVADSRVHIVLPESTLFVRDQRPASAAVLLSLKPYHSPSPSQTRAIMNLVAASVDDLAPEGVTVVDEAGRILSAEVQMSPLEEGLRGHRDSERELEDVLQSRVQTLLDQVLGPGNSVVRVKANLNFDERVVERQLFEPAENGQGYLRSVHELEESFSGSSPAPGAPGVDANVPTYVADEGNESDYQRQERIENYEIAESRERLVVAPGAVERLSVAVVVNDHLTDDQVQAISDAVSASIGYDPGRNDLISVIGQPFDTTLQDRMEEQLAQDAVAREAWYDRVIWGAAAALLALMIMGFVISRRRAARRRAEEEEREAREEAQRLAEGDRDQRRQLFPDTVPADDQLRRSIRELAREDPERVADAIKIWLHEE